MGLADLDLARDESRQSGADGPGRPLGHHLVRLVVLVHLQVGTSSRRLIRQSRRRLLRLVRMRRRRQRQRRRSPRQSQVPSKYTKYQKINFSKSPIFGFSGFICVRSLTLCLCLAAITITTDGRTRKNCPRQRKQVAYGFLRLLIFIFFFGSSFKTLLLLSPHPPSRKCRVIDRHLPSSKSCRVSPEVENEGKRCRR